MPRKRKSPRRQAQFDITKGTIFRRPVSSFAETTAWSFVKEKRFRKPTSVITTEYNQQDYGAVNQSQRSTSFGYGQRWIPANVAGKDAPPPTQYQAFRSEIGQRIGPSFGKKLQRGTQRETPGPGTYVPLAPIGKNSVQWTFAGKLQTVQRWKSPLSPNSYSPCYSSIQNGRYKSVSFSGRGERGAKPTDTPGPGTYNIAGNLNKNPRLSMSVMTKKRKKRKRFGMNQSQEIARYTF